MKNKNLLFVTLMLCSTFSFSQNIGINATGTAPANSAGLDVNFTDKGVLIPRVSLTAINSASPITSPEESLLVYNTATAGSGVNQVTPGYYYWDSSKWVRLLGGAEADGKYWRLDGNSATSSDFIGTTNNEALRFRTNGAERMRMDANGQVVVNSTSPFAGDIFSSFAAGSNSAVNGYATGSGIGVYGQANDASGYAILGINNLGVGIRGQSNDETGVVGFSTNGSGVRGQTSGASAYGVEAVNLDDNGTGLFVLGQNAPSYYTLTGGSGISSNGKRYGILSFGQNTNNGTGIAAVGNGLSTINSLVTGQGGAFTGSSTGSYSKATTSTGTGVIGVGQNASSIMTLEDGSGGAFTGSTTGIYATTTSTTGTGVIGVGQNASSMTLTDGSGAAFTGDKTGLYVYNTGDNAPGDEETILTQNSWGAQWKVGAWDDVNSDWYKIIGNGSVSTIVKDVDENDIIMFAPEAPENKFLDYGHGKLENGSVYIEIDPNFTRNILVNDDHPILIYIQPEGDCNGLFVTNKSAEGFEVKELAGGESNISFSYSIVATRGEERYENDKGDVRIAKYDKRFPRYYKTESKELESKTIEMQQIEMQQLDKQPRMKEIIRK